MNGTPGVKNYRNVSDKPKNEEIKVSKSAKEDNNIY